MGKITNVILNSNNAVSGSANSNLTYYIDWGGILKTGQKYKLHWSYVGMPNTFTSATHLAQVLVDFNTENYLNRTSSTGSPTTQCIGVLRSFYLNQSLNYLHADDDNNPSTYLANRPMNNTFRVQILTNEAVPVPWLDNAATRQPPAPYMLILSFEEIDF
jgi:hypothetical protein